ncbi:MAG TPA: LapA family protein [Gaiellaceae bacterium]
MSEAGSTEPAPQPPAEQKRKPRRSFQPGLWTRLVPVGVVGVYLILFIAFNTRMAKVDFVATSTRVSTIFLILLPLGIGIVLGVLLSQLYRHSKRRR